MRSMIEWSASRKVNGSSYTTPAMMPSILQVIAWAMKRPQGKTRGWRSSRLELGQPEVGAGHRQAGCGFSGYVWISA